MKTLLNKFIALTAIVACVLIASCSEDEDKKPSAPLVTSDVSTLPIKFGDAKTFTVSVSAAGRVKDITATTDIGTVTVSDITGVGEATGTAKINYTAPFDTGSGKITVVVNDQAEQQVTYIVSVDVTEQPPVELTAGDVDGVWGPSRTYIVRGNLRVPAGKTLTVKEGVTVIVDGDGTQANSPEIDVEGNFYSYGTADKPVVFTVADAKQTKENIFAGLWGGILATSTSQEMVVLYTHIEYAGAPAVAGSTIVTSGELKEGDPRFGLYFNNPNGEFVMMHSTIAYTKDDGMRINQGKLLIAYNTYIYNGKTGGEAVNIKSGSLGDVAYNIFYQPATNGVKWSNSDGRTPQMDVNVYNNTAINGGWRQTKAGRGGSFNLEKTGRGKAYNNIAVNCKYGTRFPKSPDNPDVANCSLGYNLYYGNNDVISAEFYPSTGSVVKGDFETGNDISGATGANDPKFVNFDVTAFNYQTAANADNLDYPATMNFALKADSPALNKGKTGFATKFTSHTVGGTTYNVPAPAAYIGALGN
ncbi:MAG TPA: hypothetical protein VIN08_19915 [Ohtaekwangia sp.]|uniref:hypothetical protein n=1 Tax=Ohtaekwangia sp. TaxID=2066019 RepID=UPI002F9457CD